MFTKKLLMPLAFSSLLAAGSAQAAPWTITTTGILDYGYFDGPTYQDWTGQAYTLAMTTDTATNDTFYSGPSESAAYGYSSPATITLSIGGNTFSYVVNSGYVSSYLDSYAGGHLFDLAGISAEGTTSDGTFARAYTNTYTFGDTGINTSFSQSYTTTAGAYENAIAYFYAFSSSYTNYVFGYDNNPDSITINSVSAVPEPETYVLMLAGLGVIGAVARRRKTKQA